jgi:hypothetical protein
MLSDKITEIFVAVDDFVGSLTLKSSNIELVKHQEQLVTGNVLYRIKRSSRF